jgi:hypothetical protein
MALSGIRRGFHEPTKQAPRVRFIWQPLGVPLYRQAKWMIRKLQRLDKTVRCAGRNTQVGTELPYSLMMVAIDANLSVLQDLGEYRARFNLHLMP